MPRDRPLQRLTQACDYCRVRKIKCDLRRPCCANCENRSLTCHFSHQQRKRGPRPTSGGNKDKDSHGNPHQALPETHANIADTSKQSESDGYQEAYSPLLSPFLSDSRQRRSPIQCATTLTRERGDRCSPLTADFIWPQHHQLSPSAVFAAVYHDLETEVDQLALGKTMPSLARDCVDHFFECLYPLMPIVYRPKIELGLCLLQPGIERREIDLEVFTLTVALCAITAAIVPSTIFSQGSLVAEKFYRISKRSLELYRHTERPTSSSIAIRYFQSGYTHSVGQPRTTWDELESAIELTQIMRLHEESSYTAMDFVESQLCRRLFWVLFTGDKSAAILGKHPITLGRDLLESGITVRYSESLEGEDPSISLDSGESFPRLITGFNLNQDLWRAAYQVLLKIESLRGRDGGDKDAENHPRQKPTTAEVSQLSDLYIAFETSLGSAPTCLRANHTLSHSPASFFFGQEREISPLPRAFALQRVNLQVSYQCLRLVIVQAISSSITPYYNVSQIWGPFSPLTYMSPGAASSSDQTSPTLARTFDIPEEPILVSESSTLLLQKVRIAEEMLHILHTSSLENLRLNGESCVEKIRLVGAAMLEIVDHHRDSLVASMASRFKELYPHILAHLRSKASDSLASDA